APGEIVFEVLPAQVFAESLPFGLAQILKSCGRDAVEETEILKITAPCLKVLGPTVNLNSDGLPATTLTLLAAVWCAPAVDANARTTEANARNTTVCLICNVVPPRD